MKIKSTVTVKLDSEDSSAIIEIKKLKLNERNEFAAKFKTEQSESVRELNQRIIQNIISVNGLFLDDKELTADDIKGGDIPAEISDAIIAAFFTVTFPKEAEEKNVLKAA